MSNYLKAPDIILTSCPNCERLEEEKVQWEPQWRSNAEANAAGYNQALEEIQQLQKQLKICKEAIKDFLDCSGDIEQNDKRLGWLKQALEDNK